MIGLTSPLVYACCRDAEADRVRAGSGELSMNGDVAEAGRSGSNDENRDPALMDRDKHGCAPPASAALLCLGSSRGSDTRGSFQWAQGSCHHKSWSQVAFR